MKLITFLRTNAFLEPFRFIGNSLFRSRAADEAIVRFCPDSLPYGMKHSALKRDMMHEKSARFFTFEEYFLYRLYALSKRERKTFVSDYERVLLLKKLNREENAFVFFDKSETYARFSGYYGREVMKIGPSDKKELREFAARHEVFVVKPVRESFGNGVRIYRTAEIPDLWARFKNEYPKGALVEELIRQNQSVAALHPQSVNTLRLTTVRLDDRVEVLFGFMRAGVGDSIVDNGGAGGIFLGINGETGVVTEAVDEAGKRYLCHPETGVQFIGSHVPMWREAIALAKELATVVPTNRYTGWDLALTDHGWIMVEGNEAGQFVGYQIPFGRGIRPMLNKIFENLGISPKI